MVDDVVASGLATYRDGLVLLIDNWNDSRGGWDVPAESIHIAQMVIPWTTQVHRFAQAFLLIEDRYEHEGHVLARSALEYSVVGHWAAKVGNNAVIARYGEDQRLLKALVRDLNGSPSDVVPSQWKSEMFAEQIDEEPVAVVDEKKLIDNFEAICHDLGVHNTLYPAYRALCWIAHPTTHAAGVYVVEGRGISETPNYREARPMGLVGLVAFSAFWSARTVDDLTVSHPNRDWLDDLATKLEVVPRLPVPKAQRRGGH